MPDRLYPPEVASKLPSFLRSKPTLVISEEFKKFKSDFTKKNLTNKEKYTAEIGTLFEAFIASLSAHVGNHIPDDQYDSANEDKLLLFYYNVKLLDTEITSKFISNKLKAYMAIDKIKYEYDRGIIDMSGLSMALVLNNSTDKEVQTFINRNRDIWGDNGILVQAITKYSKENADQCLLNNDNFVRVIASLLIIRLYPYAILNNLFETMRHIAPTIKNKCTELLRAKSDVFINTVDVISRDDDRGTAAGFSRRSVFTGDYDRGDAAAAAGDDSGAAGVPRRGAAGVPRRGAAGEYGRGAAAAAAGDDGGDTFARVPHRGVSFVGTPPPTTTRTASAFTPPTTTRPNTMPTPAVPTAQGPSLFGWMGNLGNLGSLIQGQQPAGIQPAGLPPAGLRGGQSGGAHGDTNDVIHRLKDAQWISYKLNTYSINMFYKALILLSATISIPYIRFPETEPQPAPEDDAARAAVVAAAVAARALDQEHDADYMTLIDYVQYFTDDDYFDVASKNKYTLGTSDANIRNGIIGNINTFQGKLLAQLGNLEHIRSVLKPKPNKGVQRYVNYVDSIILNAIESIDIFSSAGILPATAAVPAAVPAVAAVQALTPEQTAEQALLLSARNQPLQTTKTARRTLWQPEPKPKRLIDRVSSGFKTVRKGFSRSSGGQITKKNRKKNSGGTRKNINYNDSNDSNDSIVSTTSNDSINNDSDL